MQILAPCAGHVIAMRDVDDPVFSEQIVGPGVGIEPLAGPAQILAPADGRLLKVDPHAFILMVDDSVGILVHIGINTVQLHGDGFEVLASRGDSVSAGTPIVAWNPDDIDQPGVSTTVVVAVMDHAPDSVTGAAVGADVAVGDPLFTV
ncbi:PTS glucose transporter subunit IIA [Tessaracoccus sp. MC1865]|uniref:PTS sugar transporter subunit IIA n=1 Tax=unclassified Tessaracoccus TaxID=2635419 RepID=UPI001602CBBD|nr:MULTISPECIES: PTS glucose transporter subunit IIA [unclassified Tessaracoccus]MBB1484654.1 PTS glucose transporter subunit IIA [Tessaracoccus sp. MC1865]MBB1509224.1 PTS glucose transporter subunit IIA [Tessaracoccus sp. MC1756]QTO36397.1 PTS glucose transporter subunit IIA [Tessaracoccus sp. MC1865]